MALAFSSDALKQIAAIRGRYPTKQAACCRCCTSRRTSSVTCPTRRSTRSPQRSSCRPPTSSASSRSTRCSTASRRGRHELMVCTNISCMLRGGYDVLARAREAARHQGRRDHARRRVHARRGGVPRRLRRTRPCMICGNEYFLDLTPEKVDASPTTAKRSQSSTRRRTATAERRRSVVMPASTLRRHPKIVTAALRRREAPHARRGYQQRGGYQALRKALAMHAGGHRRRGEEVEPARPRRRRLPDRHEVGLRPQGRQARSTSSSTPTSPSPAPARTASSSYCDPHLLHRGHDHRVATRSAASTPTSTSAAR